MTFIPANPRTLLFAKIFQRISAISSAFSLIYFFLFNSKEFLQSTLGFKSFFDCFNLPTVDSNPYIDIKETSFIKKELFNFAIILLFCAQHMFFARSWFKDLMIKITPSYVFFERALFNFLSSVFLFSGMFFHQPTETIVLNFSSKYTDFVMILLLFLHLLIDLWAFYDMKDADLGGFFLIKLFEENKGAHFPIQFKQKPPSLLSKLMRHPIYYCSLSHLWLGTTKITISRLV